MRTINLILTVLILKVCLGSQKTQAENIHIDGQLIEKIWQQAKEFDDFVVTQPLMLSKAEQKTRTKFFTNDDGIYIGFINNQTDMTDVSQLTLYDEDIKDDHNEVIIDFNGKGIRAYGFKISRHNAIQDSIWTNESDESTDWNGQWLHATFNDETSWNSEIFIPWSSLSMNASQEDTREIKVYFSRWQHGLTQRYAYPAIDSSQTQFIDKFAAIEVASSDYSSFDLFPYVSSNQDLLNNERDNEFGIDIYWRPSSDKQLAMSINPDFGQVESDEIVVNFSAIETFIEEKRAFFVENHAMFDLRGPENLILVNTRRIGGQSTGEDNNSAMDINFAARYTQFSDSFEYGVLVASEDNVADIQGKDFISARLSYLEDAYDFGILFNQTKSPQHNKTAKIWALDFSYEISDGWQLTGLFFHSDISYQVPATEKPKTNDNGWTVSANYQVSSVWSQQLTLYKYGQALAINDFGFVERVNIEKLSYDSVYEWPKGNVNLGISDFSFEFGVDMSTNEQDQNLPLTSESVFIIDTNQNEEWEFEFTYQEKGIDDLITLGHLPVELPAAYAYKISYKTDQSKKLRFDMSASSGKSGLKGRWYELEFEPNYQLNEYVSIGLELAYVDRNSWLISLYEAEPENELLSEIELDGIEADEEFAELETASEEIDLEGDPDILTNYKQKEISVALNLSARFGEKHELRLKVEGVSVQATGQNIYQTNEQGHLNNLEEIPENFSESEFLAQIRYRYQISPLSEVYVVYGRGGETELNHINQSSSKLIKRSINHPTEENIFVKAKLHF